MPSAEQMQRRDRKDVMKSSCGASKSAWLAPSVSWHLGSRPGCRCIPGKPQTRSDKAKSSIVRRLGGLSHWFEPPIPRFRRQAGVAMTRRGGKNRIRFASVRSFGSWNRRRIQVKRNQRERRTWSYPPPCGEGRREAPGWGSCGDPLTAPHPNPSPQGGGEHTECAA